MSSIRLSIMVLLVIFIAVFTGCGRKTAPIFSEKGSIGMTEQLNICIDLSC